MPYDKAMIILAMINFKGAITDIKKKWNKQKQSILPSIHKMPGLEE